MHLYVTIHIKDCLVFPKKEVAKRHASMLQEMPVECRPNEQTLFQALTSALSLGPDKCAQYHEQLHIDPWIEVPPTKVGTG